MSVEWFDRTKGDPAVVVDADSTWPDQASAWIARLSARLDALPAYVEHVGSTAIAGLPAKPVLDLQVAVPDIDDERAYRPALEALGLILRARAPDHRFFRPPADQPRTVHVHVCQRGSTWERDHLLFRDYLRAHPDKARGYAALSVNSPKPSVMTETPTPPARPRSSSRSSETRVPGSATPPTPPTRPPADEPGGHITHDVAATVIQRRRLAARQGRAQRAAKRCT